jgi:hypothetical protein
MIIGKINRLVFDLHSMEHFSIQEVRAADWADLKLACIEVNKQISYALKAARFKSAQTVPLPPVLSRSPYTVLVSFHISTIVFPSFGSLTKNVLLKGKKIINSS